WSQRFKSFLAQSLAVQDRLARATGTVCGRSRAGRTSMTQRGVEMVLGRLVTDETIRSRFREAPALALRELMALGLERGPVELQALEALEPAAVQRFARSLDA